MKYLTEFKSELNDIDSNEDKLKYIIDLGEELEPLDNSFRTKDHLVKGCTSLTYVTVNLDDNNKLTFKGDSESLFAKGYLYILLESFNNSDPKVFLNESSHLVSSFVKDINLDLSVTPSRMNSFINIYQAMLERALNIVDWDLLN